MWYLNLTYNTTVILSVNIENAIDNNNRLSKFIKVLNKIDQYSDKLINVSDYFICEPYYISRHGLVGCNIIFIEDFIAKVEEPVMEEKIEEIVKTISKKKPAKKGNK